MALAAKGNSKKIVKYQRSATHRFKRLLTS